MLNILQRNVVRGFLDEGMSPEEIADYLGRLNDLGPLEVVTIRSAAYDMLNEAPAVAPAPAAGGPKLTVITGGAA
ncbi:hypothetical protein [Mycolicibacterium fortuitum]|uniref:Uncharacterized protein n=2 Tax=Mycolicibacterium fortuitum TaxID=1766 RepID=A0AAE5AFD5_MYCFO|nr:hypothetical protein [Mycolicibacterium fortuitum]MCV7137939.1 hypothetical protein [Mycolicibacterium fortuitum]MDV7194506.1 hypothetical protein [Mycolicibacterium fortuitum]MDV7207865.1 hypothetical protein [Mycolicibacterium fortuitum]MDV7229162.1 hypothetical protein [Mycolicibacterium fortuitum]MDV7260862.1 hypothetical protein [Mycolicibacterium fortuitum]